ncbi:chaperone protein dnaJ 20, chloroplastic-like [Iris pallida]|uniref:Chaperone protein dnaJ 20, chloroplastic-like n=1 Tax=Iris pallida TaxID=29817 RepID=A0AAX6H838_IRIPA|nr:chaperone protein dnaJ 20, chloroplastic-like [Iris pallida]
MSCGLLPTTTTTTTTTTILPKQPLNPRPPHPTFSSRAKKWPSLHCSCSSKSKTPGASMEEGGLFTEERAYKSFYELLGISQEGSFDDIKRAYKQMARKYHPDVSPPERAEEYTRRFIEVHEAYETLSDPGRRAIYDRDLARGFHLAFSTRRRFHEERDDRAEWKNRWQYQVEELKRRSAYNEDSAENLSWGARMRRQRAESS